MMVKSKEIKFRALFTIAIFLLAMAAPISSIAQSKDCSKSLDISNESILKTVITVTNKTDMDQLQNISDQVKADNIKYADIDKAIDDYLSGKTKELIITNTTPYAEPKDSKPFVAELGPIPDFKNMSHNQGSIVTPMTISGNLPLQRQVDGGDWAITYIFFGCNDSYLSNATSVDGRVNCLNNLEDGSHDKPYDEFVMHLYGKRSDENDAENCIQMIRYGSNAKFNFFVNGSCNYSNSITRPAGDTFAMYIKANNPYGQYNKYFDNVEFYVLDVTTMQFYTKIIPSPVTQHVYRADMAIEKKYRSGEQRPGNSAGVWKWVSSFHVYDYNVTRLNLLNNGFIYWDISPAVTNPQVLNANYTDFDDYWGDSNAEATLYMTRYSPNNPKPPHP